MSRSSGPHCALTFGRILPSKEKSLHLRSELASTDTVQEEVDTAVAVPEQHTHSIHHVHLCSVFLTVLDVAQGIVYRINTDWQRQQQEGTGRQG